MKDVKTIRAALEKKSNHQAGIANLENLLDTTSNERRQAELTCDPTDARALDSIGRQLTLEGILPRRIEARKNELPAIDAEISEVTNAAVSDLIGPKIRTLHEKTERKVREALKPHFTDPVILDQSVSRSELIAKLNVLHSRITFDSNPHDGADGHAQRILQAWEDVLTFEKDHLS